MDVYEVVWGKVVKFIYVCEVVEIIFIRGIILVINLVVDSYVEVNIEVGDEIVIFYLEYYFNLILW